MKIDLIRSQTISIVCAVLILISLIGLLIGIMEITEVIFLSLVILFFCIALFLSTEFRIPLSVSAFIGSLLIVMFSNSEIIQFDLLRIGSIGIRATDVFLFASLVFILLERMKSRSVRVPTSLTSRILFLLIAWHIFALMVGVYNGISLKDALYESRALIYFYISFFVASNWRMKSLSINAIVVVVFVGGVILATLAIARFLITNEILATYESNLGLVRQVDVFSSGYAYTFITFLFCLALLQTYRSGFKRVLVLISMALAASAILVSFTRGLWLGVVVGIASHVVMNLRGQDVWTRVRYLLVPALLITFVLGTFSLVADSPGASLLQTRFSLSIEDILKQPRIAETLEILERIGQSPILGHGLGSTFIYLHPWVGPVKTNYIHNAYLFFLFKMGAIGLFLFTTLLASYIKALLRQVRLPTQHIRYPDWLNSALLTTSIGLFAIAIFSPYILTLNYTIFLGFAFGVIELQRINT